MKKAFVLVVPLAVIVRLWVAWTDQGTIWPDEIYQSLEPGHRLAFGFGFTPWEFVDGARSWVFPGLLGGVLKVGAWFGAGSGRDLVLCAKTFMALVGVAAVWCTMQAARTLAGPTAALFAGVMATFFPASMLFGGRCMSEVASEAAVAGALAIAVGPRRSPQAVAGGLAALAVLLRYQNGLLAIGIFLLLTASSRRRDAALFAAGAASVALAGGLLDWVTWGAPFKPLVVYVRYNLEHASDYGTDPVLTYAVLLWKSTGPGLMLVLAGLAVAGARTRTRAMWILAATLLTYVGAHSLVGHKELRFLIPAAPIVFCLAGIGLADALHSLLRHTRHATGLLGPALLAFAIAAAFIARAPALTLASIGHPKKDSIGNQSAWKWRDAFNRMLWRAGKEAGLCGVAVVGPAPVWLGGFSYLHRDVPFTHVSPTDLAGGWQGLVAAANYVIVDRYLPAPPRSTVVAELDGVTLFRREGPCDLSAPSQSREWGK